MTYNFVMIKDEHKQLLIGKQIASARQAAGMTQAQLAKLLGVTQQMVGYLEQKPVAIRPELLARISEVLHIPADELLGLQLETRKNSGPTGRARRVFEEVSQLPRREQQRIIGLVEDLLAAHRLQHTQKEA